MLKTALVIDNKGGLYECFVWWSTKACVYPGPRGFSGAAVSSAHPARAVSLGSQRSRPLQPLDLIKLWRSACYGTSRRPDYKRVCVCLFERIAHGVWSGLVYEDTIKNNVIICNSVFFYISLRSFLSLFWCVCVCVCVCRSLIHSRLINRGLIEPFRVSQ